MLNSPGYRRTLLTIGSRSQIRRLYRAAGGATSARNPIQRWLVSRTRRGESSWRSDGTGCVPCCAENVSHTLATGALPTGASYKYIQRRTIAICSRRGHLLAGFARPDLPTEPRAGLLRWNGPLSLSLSLSLRTERITCADHPASTVSLRSPTSGKNPPGNKWCPMSCTLSLQWQVGGRGRLVSSCFHLPADDETPSSFDCCWFGELLFVDDRADRGIPRVRQFFRTVDVNLSA